MFGKKMASCDEVTSCISIECTDNATGVHGVVIYDDKTFPIRHDAIERVASGDGRGPYSSVQPFQFASYENEDPAALDCDPPTD